MGCPPFEEKSSFGNPQPHPCPVYALLTVTAEFRGPPSFLPLLPSDKPHHQLPPCAARVLGARQWEMDQQQALDMASRFGTSAIESSRETDRSPPFPLYSSRVTGRHAP